MLKIPVMTPLTPVCELTCGNGNVQSEISRGRDEEEWSAIMRCDSVIHSFCQKNPT